MKNETEKKLKKIKHSKGIPFIYNLPFLILQPRLQLIFESCEFFSIQKYYIHFLVQSYTETETFERKIEILLFWVGPPINPLKNKGLQLISKGQFEKFIHTILKK